MNGLKTRLSEFDLVSRMALPLPAVLVQLVIGLLFFGGILLVRYAIDAISVAAGPFALMYPAIMLATLYGHWRAGIVTWTAAFLHAWYYVLPEFGSFTFENPADLPRTMVNGVSSLIILFFAEVFRRGVSRATAERDAEIRTRDMLLQELDHRTKNNFAMVASLLELQRRAHGTGEVADALALASTRVQSFAAIHSSIYSRGAYSELITLPDYLSDLTRELRAAYFPDDRVTITVACPPVEIARDRAVALGLIVNEAVTNAAKHAFPDQMAGTIVVTFDAPPNGPWELTVRDNGRGLQPAVTDDSDARKGLGSRLIAAFAQKAGGELETLSSGDGTTIRLTETG